MTSIFIDSTAFRAWCDLNDGFSQQAAQIVRSRVFKRGRLVTTDYILDETYTGLLTRSGYFYAMKFDAMINEGSWKIEHIDEERFAASLEVFRRFNKDKQWSFTDFAFDDHFAEMGFSVLG
jgi:uncharacterized protein